MDELCSVSILIHVCSLPVFRNQMDFVISHRHDYTSHLHALSWLKIDESVHGSDYSSLEKTDIVNAAFHSSVLREDAGHVRY